MLLFAYPSDFRPRFGSGMVTTFSDLIRGEWEYNGLPGVARVWRSALGEVFSAAVPLQLQNSIVVATSLSLPWSFALFVALFGAMSLVCHGKIMNWFSRSKRMSAFCLR
jgi:hypothetical protein